MSSAIASLEFPADDANKVAESIGDAFGELQLLDAFGVEFSELFGVTIAFLGVGSSDDDRAICW